jgi:hypothetical protein
VQFTRPAVFAVLPAELSAIDASCPAEILTADGIDDRKNSVALAVLSRLSPVLLLIARMAAGASEKPVCASSDEIGMPATIS